MAARNVAVRWSVNEYEKVRTWRVEMLGKMRKDRLGNGSACKVRTL